jgi:hypothetical protein
VFDAWPVASAIWTVAEMLDADPKTAQSVSVMVPEVVPVMVTLLDGMANV